MRRGFTLIELSIALVIIGLLIGGILAAQSMISTAKINSQAQQIAQFDAMVMNFKERFNFLPGDAPAFGGDGDGVIAQTAATFDNNVGSFACEIANFWNTIDAIQFPGSSPCAAPGAKANISGPEKNVPESKLGAPNSYLIAIAMSVDGHWADLNSPRNFYVILSGSQAQSTDSGYYQFSETTTALQNSALKTVDAFALDKKLDDGNANTGNVLSGAMGPFCCAVGGMTQTPLPTCSDGAGQYLFSSTGYECTALIRIGGMSGDPQ